MNKGIKYSYLLIAFIAMGFSSMISQIVLLRELVLLFTGNELTLGIILALWLLWTAFGSGVMGRLIKFSARPLILLISCQFLLVVLLPLSVIFIRSSRLIFSVASGEITNPIFVLIVPLIALAPVCIIVGFLYTLGCKLLSQTGQKIHSSVPGRVFLFEAIGSGIAGFIASIILFRFLENFQIVTIVCIVNLGIAFLFWIVIRQKLLPLLIPCAVISIAMMIFLFPRLDDFSNKKLWGDLQLLHSETTIYGNIVITGLGESISFYENGVLMFTHPDLMYAEESVHFALLEHLKPHNVLLIGGDAAGSLPQVLYHPQIQRVDFVLLDPKSIQLAQEFLPSLAEILKDERIKIWYRDGRIFLKQTDTKYDVIIVNLPDPQTALINRFYTLEFYQSVQKKLTQDGILSFSITSSENVLSDEQTVFLNDLYRTMKQVFEDIVLIPGNSIHFIGCCSSGVLTDDPQVLVQRLQQRRLPTLYIREYYIPFRMAKDRMDYIDEKITQYQIKNFNRDFQPIGYFYSIILWLTYFNIDLKTLIHYFDWIGKYILFLLPVILFILVLLWFIFSGRKRQSTKPGILLAIMTIGFSEISLEVLIILGFQAIYGYAYYQLALIMSGFMIGLTIGSWYSLKSIQTFKSGFKNFLLFQFILTLYPLITFVVLLTLSRVMLPAFAIQIIFLLLIIGAGFLGGFQFPLANHLIFKAEERIERVGGMLYASDLFGSVIGALITSTLLIPLFGLGYTCVVFSILNLGILIILLLNFLSIKRL